MPANIYRTENGVRVPGVTTIIGARKETGGLMHWAWQMGIDGLDYRDARDGAAESGTMAHSMIEHDITKNDAAFDASDPLFERAMNGFKQYKVWAAQTKLKVLCSELTLVSEKYKFGGQIDAVGYVNEELSLIDWKTSNAIYADHLIQAVAYIKLYNENNEDNPITGGVHICRFSKEHADFAHHHFKDGLIVAWRTFLAMMEVYQNMKELKKRVR